MVTSVNIFRAYSWLYLNWASLPVTAAFVGRSHCFVKANKVALQEQLSRAPGSEKKKTAFSASFTDLEVNLSRSLCNLYSKGKLYYDGKQDMLENSEKTERIQELRGSKYNEVHATSLKE